MNNRLLINMIPGDTFLHKLSGTTKVRLFVILMVYLIMSFDLRLLVPLFIICLIGLFSLKPNWRILKPFFVIVLLMNLLNIVLFWVADPAVGEQWVGRTRTILFSVTPRLFISRETLWYLAVRIFKMYTSFLVSLVFILSIVPSELAAGLYSMGVPYKICSVFSLAFRYIPDIGRDFQNIKISMQARGVEMDSRRISLMKRLKQTTLILVPLIITSFDRIGTISNAMDLRGYGRLKKRSYYSEHEPTRSDKVFFWLTLALGLFCLYWVIVRNVLIPGHQMWYPYA
ncbi:energy-coupling factor transporter transmembrane component T family protein [Parasphaerochaeta coccoides]|uniref:Cobalt transport protein n=1 Tax=Parasphaerochaeta coccoides (strain ATCC BAA-1237 / DSM 17374 / SPN1) TaxID=760011 RepID=F4GHK9_PARC1|nr:energy-coupling factor transporter transmembrane component T [Parasphaerochaeta coccoides]AEC02598.1 cobalt transport protein [Parasphaerochaeta coccoides DSM 17374]